MLKSRQHILAALALQNVLICSDTNETVRRTVVNRDVVALLNAELVKRYWPPPPEAILKELKHEHHRNVSAMGLVKYEFTTKIRCG